MLRQQGQEVGAAPSSLSAQRVRARCSVLQCRNLTKMKMHKQKGPCIASGQAVKRLDLRGLGLGLAPKIAACCSSQPKHAIANCSATSSCACRETATRPRRARPTAQRSAVQCSVSWASGRFAQQFWRHGVLAPIWPHAIVKRPFSARCVCAPLQRVWREGRRRAEWWVVGGVCLSDQPKPRTERAPQCHVGSMWRGRNSHHPYAALAPTSELPRRS